MKIENSTPAITAVARPLNVPMNSIGKPSVNTMSHNTCVLTSFSLPNILYIMIKYPIAVKKEITNKFIIYIFKLILIKNNKPKDAVVS